jgi:hypothetical protein
MEVQRTDAGWARVGMLRHWILCVLMLGLLGTVTELILLGHYEQPLQFVPLVLIGLAFVTLAWNLIQHGPASRRALGIVMLLFVLAGFAGAVAHFIGSAEYQLELDPSMNPWDLLVKVMRAKAPPVLAPGMMLQLGLLGLAYVLSDCRKKRSGTP